MTYLLALDQGTSSSRSIVFDADGTIVAMAQQEITQIYPHPGWVEHDPLEIWRTQLATAREVLLKAGISAQQVRAMAESGILVAVHGAALTNVIFMPANAVLIEVFPWNYRSFLYRDLAWKAGLQYYPMSSVYPDFENIDPALLAKRGDGVYGVYSSAEYQTKCSGPHMSSMDVYSIAECTHRAKDTFPMVNIEQLKVVVQDALDDIGCRDSYCHEVEFRRNDEPVIHHITHMPTKNKTQYIP